jgi:Bifunctional DNA primase/polymerase, N-terminal
MPSTDDGTVALAGVAEASVINRDQHSDTELARPQQVLDAALGYAARGWPGFPCQWQGLRRKHPLTVHGHLDASTDPAVITAWWRRWPKALIGVSTGRASGFVVLDVDVKYNDRYGFETLAALGHAILPDTPMAHTASGGLHVYFASPLDFEIGCTEGGKGRGIGRRLDWRGTGGYVIAPSPNSGYWWGPYWSPETVALAPVPSALLPRKPERRSTAHPVRPVIGLSPYGEAALDSACRHIMSAPAGEQEVTMHGECFSIGTLAGAGAIPANLTRRTLIWAARQMPDHDPRRPWRAHETEAKVNRAFDEGMRHPREARCA